MRLRPPPVPARRPTTLVRPVVAAVLTEVLSPFHWLRQGPLAAAWLLTLVLGIAFLKYGAMPGWARRRVRRSLPGKFRKPRLGFDAAIVTATIAAISAIA